MVLIFWQGIISIHQKSFLEALAKQPAVTKVLMVVETDITSYRKDMGWEVPTVQNVEVIVAPGAEKIKDIFKAHRDAIHIFGGVRVGKMMTTAFDEGAKVKARMGVMSEPYDKSGWKGMLRHMKYHYQRMMYYRHVQFFMAIGREGVRTFTDLGFKKDRVFPWAYFVSVPQCAFVAPTGPTRIIYAGRIEEAKGILRFVQELANVPNGEYALDIYGGGTQEEALRALIIENGLTNKIRIHPFMPYSEMIQQYGRYDWVILPSTRKDGWGVIISEGLLNGLKGVASNICGVSWAVKDGFNGQVFDWNEQDSCAKAIEAMLKSKGYAQRNEIQNWAQRSLSAEAGAKYCLQILDCVYYYKPAPAVPWEQN